MDGNVERNLGEQPIAAIMRERGLKPHDIVAASAVPMTHKMVARAAKGRRLTANSKRIVRDALNRAAEASYAEADLFNY